MQLLQACTPSTSVYYGECAEQIGLFLCVCLSAQIDSFATGLKEELSSYYSGFKPH